MGHGGKRGPRTDGKKKGELFVAVKATVWSIKISPKWKKKMR